MRCSSKNSDFSFLRQVIPILFARPQKCVGWGSHHLVSEPLGSKIRFTILLPFVSCYHSILLRLYSLFIVLVLCRAPSWKKKKEKGVILKQQILSFTVLLKVNLFLNRDFCSFSSLKKKKNLIFLSSSFDSLFLSYFLAVGIGLNTTSWISWSCLLVSWRTEKGKLLVEKGKRVWD